MIQIALVVLKFSNVNAILFLDNISHQFTEVRFASFLSGRFITAIVVNPPERKLANRTSVQLIITPTNKISEKMHGNGPQQNPSLNEKKILLDAVCYFPARSTANLVQIYPRFATFMGKSETVPSIKFFLGDRPFVTSKSKK